MIPEGKYQLHGLRDSPVYGRIQCVGLSRLRPALVSGPRLQR